MLVKIAAVAGTVIGWGSAAGLIFLEQHPQLILVQALALGVGLLSSTWLLLACRSRPMSAAFELGYEMGRRDAMKSTNRGTVVQLPIRLERRAMNE